MRKRIIDSFPPVIRQIKEFGEIARSFDLEFEKLEGQTARVLRNMFLDTARLTRLMKTGLAVLKACLGFIRQKAWGLRNGSRRSFTG